MDSSLVGVCLTIWRCFQIAPQRQGMDTCMYMSTCTCTYMSRTWHNGRPLDSEGVGLTALSDTEVEVGDRRPRQRNAARRGHTASKGSDKLVRGVAKEGVAKEGVSLVTSTSEEELRGHLEQRDRSGFWSALTRMLQRKHSNRFSSSMEDCIYLDDIDYESMDPDELSEYFPARCVHVHVCLCVCTCVCMCVCACASQCWDIFKRN